MSDQTCSQCYGLSDPDQRADFHRTHTNKKWFTFDVNGPQRFVYLVTRRGEDGHSLALERRVGRSRDLVTYFEQGFRVWRITQPER